MPEVKLPEGAECYRKLGPWDEAAIPEGLRRQHNLKEGCWGMIGIPKGELMFLWDDGLLLVSEKLIAGDSHLIPPLVPHHLHIDGPVEMTLRFYRLPEGVDALRGDYAK
jgi:tellurite resistance-related uncharacterized protein